MSEASWNDDAAARQRLSDLMDGEADAETASQVCGEWRRSCEARADWHAYQLIGDVLRSDDLAHAVERDEAFLTAFRARLAAEPVVLAPVPATQASRRRRAWRMPAAAAAGFMAVAGVLVVTRGVGPDAGGSAPSTLARAPGSASVTVRPVVQDVDAQIVAADGKLIRDARLERYLAAHKKYGNSSAVSMPGVVLRSSATAAER